MLCRLRLTILIIDSKDSSIIHCTNKQMYNTSNIFIIIFVTRHSALVLTSFNNYTINRVPKGFAVDNRELGL